MQKTRVVGILGGMGPAAGADFARLFVQACTEHMQACHMAVSDQAFPEHWLAQIPVPDRSAALASTGPDQDKPLDPMLQAVGKLAALGATTVAIACNTAHAWHGQMQERFAQLEVLHIARELAQTLTSRGVDKVGLLATEGTYKTGLYDKAFRRVGVQCHLPLPSEREQLMRGIYQGVKAGDMALARDCFSRVAKALADRHSLSTLVMGCTEIPLALSSVPGLAQLDLIDPAFVLAQRLAQRAYAETT